MQQSKALHFFGEYMKLSESLRLIKSFFSDEISFGDKADFNISSSLEQEKGVKFPPEFKEYIDQFAPDSKFYFTCVGNALEILSRGQLSWFMDGYNFNSVLNEPIEEWNDDWFIFADEGADPVIVKLSEKTELSTVYKAMHGAGKWEFHPVADSIGQFLLCAAAVHHALSGFDIEDSIIDNEDGFNLAEEPSVWLYPFIEKYAAEYYDEWVSVFENS
jgi:hypothetical protein